MTQHIPVGLIEFQLGSCSHDHNESCRTVQHSSKKRAGPVQFSTVQFLFTQNTLTMPKRTKPYRTMPECLCERSISALLQNYQNYFHVDLVLLPLKHYCYQVLGGDNTNVS